MPRLTALHQLNAQHQTQAAPDPASTLPPALATLLGETQDSGTLNFDWLTKK